MTESIEGTPSEATGAVTTLQQAASSIREGKGFDALTSALALAHGVPVPPSIIRRIRECAGRLLSGTFNSALRYVERHTERLDFEAKVQRDLVVKAANEGLAHLPDETKHAIAMGFLNEYALKLENKSAVVAEALTSIAHEEALEDEHPDAEISKDWLNHFSDVAAQKCDPEMRRLMGRILAGEIRQPGSYSPLTIQRMSTLTSQAATLFERLSHVVAFVDDGAMAVMTEHEYEAGKGFPELKISWTELALLASYGLLETAHATQWHQDGPESMSVRGRKFIAKSKSGNQVEIYGYLLSESGREIYQLLDFSDYFDFDKWVQSRLVPYGIEIDTSAAP
ncbi:MULTISPECIES: DUF2806 domain-containing protein [unclassified Burkholderia]|uniref:DUF2806 domain-containing protein n=1 Tax=unclassified Burkholderia TaxID=2613784 RepID=UPI000F57EC93|nr:MULTISPECIES: DUF2806 domain-containing protein [unclassified Burkholderia]RQR81453.1 DUF2806 domain-containing protein [Burkholderia sp. Bp9011]RQR91029.1 DUF2806 domain-containing protein [Burkholderia sp. Bp9010]RQS75176.1 DUF2806 domain-containing protein [Burkholderia sp. Bp8977]